DLVAADGRRGGHLPVRGDVPPSDLAVPHRDRPHLAARVADVRHPVRDDGGELDRRAHALAPDHPEGRAEPDPRLRLGPRRRRAVDRPLEARLVDRELRPRASPEPEAARRWRVPARSDRDERRRAAADAQEDVAVAVRDAGAPAEPDVGAGDGSPQVAVEDGYEDAL